MENMDQDSLIVKIMNLLYPAALFYAVCFVADWLTLRIYSLVLSIPAADAYESISENNGLMILSCIEKIAIIIVFAIIYLKDSRVRLDVSSVRRTNGYYTSHDLAKKIKMILWITIASIAFCIAGNLLIELSGMAYKDAAYIRADEISRSSGVWIAALAAVLLAPLSEEIFFRGIMYKRARKSFGPLIATIISSLFFAAIHNNMTQGIYAFAAGTVFAFIIETTGDLKKNIFSHLLMNLFVISGFYDIIKRMFCVDVIRTVICIIFCVALLTISLWRIKDKD